MPTTTFNSSGTWTVPAGVTTADVVCRGPGGSGAGTVDAGPGGGGGGGAYALGEGISVTPGNDITIQVGTDALGTATFFSSSGVLQAGGGADADANGNGGAGGTASGSALTTGYAGGNGGDGGTTTGGGGGAGAGSGGAGANGVDGDSGGAGGTGAGGGGDGGDGQVSSTDNGTAPGGGGGGSGGGSGGEGANGRVTVTWADAPDDLEIITLTLPDGQVNSAYSQSVTAEGGTGSYAWSVISGSVPTGTSLASTGTPSTTLSGTPTTSGTYNFTVQVEDDASDTDTQAYEIDIAEESPSGPIITTTFVLDGPVGTAYSDGVGATGGTTPYTWAIVSGSLPPGLSLDDETFENTPVLIVGTPTTAGVYTFTIQVTDDNALTDDEEFTITITGLALRRVWGGLTRNPLLGSNRARV